MSIVSILNLIWKTCVQNLWCDVMLTLLCPMLNVSQTRCNELNVWCDVMLGSA